MKFFGLTDIGRTRKQNQDSIFICDDFENVKYFIIADGMGGVNGGEIASTTAISAIKSYIDENIYDIELVEDQINDLIRGAISRANKEIYEIAEKDETYKGMGTTVILAITFGNRVYIGHIGDSRLYRIRKNIIRQLTTDHSYVQALLKEGTITKEQAYNHPQKNILLKVVGCEPYIEPDILVKGFLKDDVLLMCTDGLTNMLTNEEIFNIITNEKNNLENTCKHLIDAANGNGGNDNISVILVSKD